MGKGGRTSTTWANSWLSGKTKNIRIPEVLENEVIAYARARDKGQSLLQGNSRDTILAAFSEYRKLRGIERHPNQHSLGRELDVKARTWDELRKFIKMVEDAPEKLGLI